MTVLFGDYRVKSNSTGWIVQKKRGSQWKKTQYYNNLKSLVDALLVETFNKTSGNLVVDFGDKVDEAAYTLEAVNEILDECAEEIADVFYDELTHS